MAEYEVTQRQAPWGDDDLEVVTLRYPPPHNCDRVEIWWWADDLGDMTSEQAVALGRALIAAAGQVP